MGDWMNGMRAGPWLINPNYLGPADRAKYNSRVAGKRRKGCLIASGVVAAAVLGAGIFYGPTLLDFLKVFGIEGLQKPEKHAYSATSEQNLKALYQGMLLYHESEGQFPEASGWMDAIRPRLLSNDLAKGEADKKLIRPDLAGSPDTYGYAMNDLASAKYKDDIKDPAKTPLLYETKQTSRNAKGDGKEDRIGMAIAVDGTILRNP